MKVRSLNGSYRLNTLSGAIEVRSWDYSDITSTNFSLPYNSLTYILYPQPFSFDVTVESSFGETFSCSTGNLMFIPSAATLNFRAQIAAHCDSITTIACEFDETYFESIVGVDIDWDPRLIRTCLKINSMRLKSYMTSLASEVMTHGYARQTLAENLNAAAAIEFARYIRGTNVEHGNSHSGGLAPWQLKKIRRLISDHAGSPVPAQVAAEECGISTRHLSRAFRKTVGMTLHEYMNNLRLSRAMTLLADSELSIKAISAELGYSQQSGFSIAFKNGVGMSPKSFRETAQGVLKENWEKTTSPRASSIGQGGANRPALGSQKQSALRPSPLDSALDENFSSLLRNDYQTAAHGRRPTHGIDGMERLF